MNTGHPFWRDLQPPAGLPRLRWHGERLPTQDSNGAVIIAQQYAVRARYRSTDPADLGLLPAPLRNLHGTRPMPLHTLGEVHRRWGRCTVCPAFR